MIIWAVWATAWDDALLPEGINFAAFTKEECEDWIKQTLPDLVQIKWFQWGERECPIDKYYCLVMEIDPQNKKYQQAMALLFGRL